MNFRRIEQQLSAAVRALQRSLNKAQTLAELEDKQGRIFANEVWQRFCARRDRV